MNNLKQAIIFAVSYAATGFLFRYLPKKLSDWRKHEDLLEAKDQKSEWEEERKKWRGF